jgi:peptidoglycan glycosyltransferase
VVLWVASERWIVLAFGGGLFVVGALLSWQLFDHVQTRVDIWLDPFADPKGDGYQIVEASFALADGGLSGTGLGHGEPGRIPFVETDFIFAAIGEELGMAGSAAVLMAFLILVGSGLRIALRASRIFDKLFALGLTTLVGVQAFVIIGGVLRVVPLTGITLPFVSYGGSSLVANYALLALLVRLSHEQRTAEMT